MASGMTIAWEIFAMGLMKRTTWIEFFMELLFAEKTAAITS
jgi:hypothetical protein